MLSLSTIARVTGAGAVAAAAVCALVTPALADPPSGVTPAATDIVGVGSDTTEFFLDQLSLSYDAQATVPNGRKLYSYDATGSSPIVTKTGATSIPRPDGSSSGITALINNTSTTVDFARSSRPRGTDPTSVKFVAFAKDAVTAGVQTTTNAPANLTTANLKSIYTCQATKWNQVGGTSGNTIKPFLPQSGSGTRAFFLSAIGVTEAQITNATCVTQGVQENEGTDTRLQNPDTIVPYSVAKYIAQVYHSGSGQNSFGTDVHGSIKLDNLNGTSPTTGTAPNVTINPSFSSAFIRTVFNVVRADSTTSDGIPAYLEPVFGTSGYLCQSGSTIVRNYGFLPLSGAQCGATS